MPRCAFLVGAPAARLVGDSLLFRLWTPDVCIPLASTCLPLIHWERLYAAVRSWSRRMLVASVLAHPSAGVNGCAGAWASQAELCGLTWSLKPEQWAYDHLALRNQRATQVHATAASTNKGIDLGIDQHRQPFSLYSEAKVATEIEFDTSTQPKRKTGEAPPGSDANMGRTDTAYNVGPRPNRPVIEEVLMREVTVKLIQDCPLAGGALRAFQMDTGVLPRPTEFNHILFVAPHPRSNAIARRRVKNETGSWFFGPGWKAHAGSITDERSDIKTEGFGRKLIAVGGLRSNCPREQDE